MAAIPQIKMNYSNLGEFSMSVPTNNLMFAQVSWGFGMQRYDTYGGFLNDPVHSSPRVVFYDPVGTKLLNEAGIAELSSWSDFIKIFLKHPIDIISMYVRHFINYLFPCFREVYIYDLNASKWGWGILGVTLFFITGFAVLKKCVKNLKNIIYFIPVIIPGILIIPGAVEYRFSLPIYFFAICLLCFNTDWKKVKDQFLASKLSTAAVYLIICLLCFSIWSQCLACESVTPLLL